MRLLKILLYLIVLLAALLVGYAYLGDLSPEQRDVVEPIELEAG